MRFAILIMLLLSATDDVVSQDKLTLERCYQLAEENYPMVRQRDLIAATRSYSVANVMTGKLPRISIGAQATYQSEVTQIPVEMPGIEPLAKDQYRVFGEVTQTVFDGGTTAARKQLEE